MILSGGAGTRLWPLSTEERPKQFLPLFGGQSLLQKTWKRLAAIVAPESILVSTVERYRALCAEQLPLLPAENLIVEPERRNTAAAIALACFEIESRIGRATIGVFPADHFIEDEAAFAEVVRRAFQFANEHEYLVTIGIEPTAAHTGFGYLALGEELAPHVARVERFVEKPSLQRAEEFLRAGTYAWNGGMFVWRSDVFRRELERVAPEISRVTVNSYSAMPSTSIDYALMEKASRVAAVRGEFGWSDVGSWNAITSLAPSLTGIHTREAEGVFAYTVSGRRVVVIGVSNVVIAESEEGILVLELSRSEQLAEVVRGLGEKP